MWISQNVSNMAASRSNWIQAAVGTSSGHSRSLWELELRKTASREHNAFVVSSETSRKDWRILSCDTRSFGMYFLTRLNKSNKMKQYADIYLLLNYCTCFGRPSRPSSGVHKTVVAYPGTYRSYHLGSKLLQTWPNKDLIWSRLKKFALQMLWSVPEAATSVLCTPDVGRDGRPKHVQ